VTRTIVLFLVALVASVLIYPALIGQLARARMRQQIREEGPQSHHAKAGTPTAGGALFLVLGTVLYLVSDRSRAGGLVVLALLLGGALGAVDDLRAIRGGRSLGLRARHKIVVQLAVGGLLGWLAWRLGFSGQAIPFDGVRSLGAWLIPIGALAVAAGSNAFNLTDGSDGLAGGAGAIAFATLALTALYLHHPGGAYVSAVLAGTLLGFLVYNVFPARVFMGDTGSLALGTAMVAAAIVNGFLWYLPLLALIFVLETLSVVAQVVSFKMTGKRIFLMSPLHHHFHLLGWPEMRIAVWFWAVGLLAAVLTLLARPASLPL